MVGQKLLIKSRSDLREENRIAVVLKSLVFLSKPSVHRMPSFVSQGKDIRQNIRSIIHQDKGRIFVAGRGESAATFTLGFVPIHPARFQTVSQGSNIFVPQRF